MGYLDSLRVREYLPQEVTFELKSEGREGAGYVLS